MRIFVGPLEIAGIAQALVNGFSEMGVYCRLMLAYPHQFRYGDASDFWLARVWQRVGARRAKTAKQQWMRKGFWFSLHQLCGWLVFGCCLFRFDVFIFFFGASITNSLIELWLLRLFGKKILFVYVGSDARPPYIDGVWFPAAACDETKAALACTLASKFKKRVLQQERYASYLINSPSTAHFHERPYINWFAIGIPKSPLVAPPHIKVDSQAQRPVRILHSPSHPIVKGSAYIQLAIERLRAQGYSIDFVKIENASNDVVMSELARCDFVIDQLYSDTPMAVFATEAAHFGKPAIVGGYFADDHEKVLPPDFVPPSLYVVPDELEVAIVRLIEDYDFRIELGARAKEFVTTTWSAAAVARRYLDLIDGRPEDEWWCDPATIRYVFGCGMDDQHAARMVASVIDFGGVSALQLSDKPELERCFLDLALRERG